MLKCSTQSRLASFKLGKISFKKNLGGILFWGEEGKKLTFLFSCFDLKIGKNIIFEIFLGGGVGVKKSKFLFSVLIYLLEKI